MEQPGTLNGFVGNVILRGTQHEPQFCKSFLSKVEDVLVTCAPRAGQVRCGEGHKGCKWRSPAGQLGQQADRGELERALVDAGRSLRCKALQDRPGLGRAAKQAVEIEDAVYTALSAGQWSSWLVQ